MAEKEGKISSTRPDPGEVSIDAANVDFVYNLRALWEATDRKFLLSQLIRELRDYEGLYRDVFEVDNLLAITKEIKRLKKGTTLDG